MKRMLIGIILSVIFLSGCSNSETISIEKEEQQVNQIETLSGKILYPNDLILTDESKGEKWYFAGYNNRYATFKVSIVINKVKTTNVTSGNGIIDSIDQISVFYFTVSKDTIIKLGEKEVVLDNFYFEDNGISFK